LHFKTFQENGHAKAECKYCKKVYNADPRVNGTSTLHAHAEHCKKNPHNEETRQKLLSFQQSIGGSSGEGSLGNWEYDEVAIRKALTYFIILDEQPFKLVEGVGFRYFMSIACPRFHLPSRWTIQRDCYQLYIDEKENLKNLLKATCQMVSFTTDTWTSIQNINYMCLTAHWIDNDWKLNKRILNFCPIPSHKGDELGRAVERCLVEWGIENVFTITVDNASSNDTMIAYLKKRLNNWNGTMLHGKYLHMRCIAHIVNLIVNDGIKELGSSVARVRSAVKYVRSSPSRLQKFKNCVEIEKIEWSKTLCLDVPTRWNSTYLMLNTACKYERAFERYGDEDPFFRNQVLSGNGNNEMPLEDDWTNARRLCTFLEKFYELTLRVSGSLYVTSNSFLHEISNVACELIDQQESGDLELSNIRKMQEKFGKILGKLKKDQHVDLHYCAF